VSDPAALVASIEAKAELRRTPCGSGSMVWHIWGNGPPLALLHGGYGSWTHWIRNVEPLSRHRRVLAADIPGLGDSDTPPEPHDSSSLAAIVADGLVNLLRPEERVDIAGFSFGGVIGGHVAERLGSRVRNLVLCGSGGLGIPRRAKVELVNWRMYRGKEKQRAAHRENLGILMLADPANIDELAVYLQVHNAERARTKSRPLSRVPSLREALPRIGARLHGIWGEQDITARDALDEHAQLLRSFQPEATFTVILGAGHWVQYEAPEAFNRALESIVSDVTPADRSESRGPGDQ
jgi:pimeloyl-ACP methyl ester carboxylesterase